MDEHRDSAEERQNLSADVVHRQCDQLADVAVACSQVDELEKHSAELAFAIDRKIVCAELAHSMHLVGTAYETLNLLV